MKERTATCACGQLKIHCDGDPVRVSMCHCLECQKRTGSVFGVQARFEQERVRAEGKESQWLRVGDEGSRITFHFCPTCGTTVYYENDKLPGVFGIPVGGFADPTFPAPKVSIYGVRRHAWTAMPDLEIEDLD